MGKGNKFKSASQLAGSQPPETPGPPGLGVKGVIMKKKKEQQPLGKHGGAPQQAAASKQLGAAPAAPAASAAGRQQEQPAGGHAKPPLTSNQRRKARRKALQQQGGVPPQPQPAKAGQVAPAPAQPPAERPLQPEAEAPAAARPTKRAKTQPSKAAPPAPSMQPQPPAAAAASPAEPAADATAGKQRAAGKGAGAKRPPQPAKPVPKTVLEAPKPGALGNSNWAALKAVIGGGKRTELTADLKGSAPSGAAAAARPQPRGASTETTPVLAVDCEMVGVGPDGARSSLARVCIVNSHGNVLLDALVRQKERVTDFRTRFSGIRPADIADDVARPFEEVQAAAAALFKDRILVGHAIHNDLKALLLSHPRKLVRDTARFPPLMRATAPGRKPRPRALRHLAFELLGLGIQEGEHSPVEDARAALYLYQRFATDWERRMHAGTMKQLAAPMQLGCGHKPVAAGKSLAELAAKDVMVDL